MSLGPPISDLRLMLRAANEFALEVFGILRGGRDFTDALLLMALAPGSGPPLSAGAAAQRDFAAFDTPPPDGVRRPLSVSALAVSLGLPFETARRRIRGLVEDGSCEVTPHGIRLSAALLTSPEHHRVLEQTHDAIRDFYLRLRRAECLAPPQAPGADALRASPPPLRLIWRAVAEYMLRLMEFVLPNVASPATAFVMLAVVRANTRAMSDQTRGHDGLGVESFVSDALRHPARTSEIAVLLGLPYETTRRHLRGLVEDGRCVQVDKRFVVPAAVLARPNLFAAQAANLTNLNRMLALLADSGIVARWEARIRAESSGPGRARPSWPAAR